MSAALLWRHLAVWQAAKTSDLEPEDRQFFYRQFRRRVQTSAMIGVVGVLIMGHDWVQTPLAGVLYLVGLVLAVCWILLMAFWDLLATKVHLQKMQVRRSNQRSEMEAEVKRLRQEYGRREGNGKSP